jgi:hypothetical protein
VEVRLSVAGVDQVEELHDLASWLGGESELRGRVKRIGPAPAPGELGATADILVAAVSGGGAVSVLVGSLLAYLSQPRHSDVRITVEGPEGRRVELDAKRVHDVEGLVRQVLGPRE